MIRPWTEADIDATRRILRESWGVAYSSFIPREDLEGYLEAQYSPDALRVLHRTAGVAAFIVESAEEPAGYARTRYDSAAGRFYLSSLYVLPSAQGKGLGTALMAAAEAEARRTGADRIWVGVMERNRRTLEWYSRLGFAFTEREPFRMGGTTVEHRIGYRELAEGPIPTAP